MSNRKHTQSQIHARIAIDAIHWEMEREREAWACARAWVWNRQNAKLFSTPRSSYKWYVIWRRDKTECKALTVSFLEVFSLDVFFPLFSRFLVVALFYCSFNKKYSISYLSSRIESCVVLFCLVLLFVWLWRVNICNLYKIHTHTPTWTQKKK